MKPRCGINLISYGRLLDKYFILSKGNFNQNKRLKTPAMGYGNLSNGQVEYIILFTTKMLHGAYICVTWLSSAEFYLGITITEVQTYL